MKIYAFVRSNVPRVLHNGRIKASISSDKTITSPKARNRASTSGTSGFRSDDGDTTPEVFDKQVSSTSKENEEESSEHNNQEAETDTSWASAPVSTSSPSSPTSSSLSLTRKRRIGGIDRINGSNEDEERLSDTEFLSRSGGTGSNRAGSTNAELSYSKYLYFYMAPTLIYKDRYPR